MVHLRSVFVAAVEQEERVGFAEEVFLVELLAAPLHSDLLLARTHLFGRHYLEHT